MKPKNFKHDHGTMVALRDFIASLPDSGSGVVLVPFKNGTQWYFKALLTSSKRPSDITETVGCLLNLHPVGEWGNIGLPMAGTSDLFGRCFQLTQSFREWNKRVAVSSAL